MDILIVAGIRVLEAMFLVGMIGSTIVIIITSVEDVKTLFESDQPAVADHGKH